MPGATPARIGPNPRNPDSDSAAASQAESLNLLLNIARGATQDLAGNSANNGLKEVLRTAEIKQQHNRVVVNAALPKDLPLQLLNSGDADAQPAN